MTAAGSHLPIVDQVSVTVQLGELEKLHNFLVVASLHDHSCHIGNGFSSKGMGFFHHVSHSDTNAGQSACTCTCTQAQFQNIQCSLGIWGGAEEKWCPVAGIDMAEMNSKVMMEDYAVLHDGEKVDL